MIDINEIEYKVYCRLSKVATVFRTKHKGITFYDEPVAVEDIEAVIRYCEQQFMSLNIPGAYPDRCYSDLPDDERLAMIANALTHILPVAKYIETNKLAVEQRVSDLEAKIEQMMDIIRDQAEQIRKLSYLKGEINGLKEAVAGEKNIPVAAEEPTISAATSLEPQTDFEKQLTEEIPCFKVYPTKYFPNPGSYTYESFCEAACVACVDDDRLRAIQRANLEKYLIFVDIGGGRFRCERRTGKGAFLKGNTIEACIAKRAINAENVKINKEYTYAELCEAVGHVSSTKKEYKDADIKRILEAVQGLTVLDNGNYIIQNVKKFI